MKKKDFRTILLNSFNILSKYYSEVGVSVKGNESGINLTLRRTLDEMQSVQIVLGNFTKENIEIEIRREQKIEKSIKNNSAFIKIGKVEYEITHEALYYLFKIKVRFN